MPALPRPQANALAVALLVDEGEGPPPDQRAIALAFTGALRALARNGPVVVAIDDIQWLDPSSAFLLEFALRRLDGAALAFLLALRQEEATPSAVDLDRALPEERLRRLRVGPLSLGAMHRLLSERLDLVLPRPRLRRLRELSGGNPLFALELGRALRRGAILLEPGEPLPGSLAALVHDRLAALPAETRPALLAASAASDPTLELVDARGWRTSHRPAGARRCRTGDRVRGHPYPVHPPTAGLRHLRGGPRRGSKGASPAAGAAPPGPGGARPPPRARHRFRGRRRGDRARAGGRAGTRPRCPCRRGGAVRAGPAADARWRWRRAATAERSKPRATRGRPERAAGRGNC